MNQSRILGILLLLFGAALPGRAAGDSVALRPATPLEREQAADFQSRRFPSFLRIGPADSPRTADAPRRGNARMIEATGRPSVLREGPRLLSDFGEDPLAALAKLRRQADPETIRICAIRVDFAEDGAGDASTGNGRFDLRDPEEAEVAIDPPPHDKAYFESHLEAVRRYYDVQSNGGLVLEYDVFPEEPDSAYTLSNTARYGPWIFSVSSDSILARAERFVRDSITQADSLDAAIDWKEYQSFLVFHAGADFQGDINRDTNYDIPSFNLFLGDSLEVVVGGPDSVHVNLVMVIPETVSQDDFLGALNGVMAHEYGHQLGFFDLYDIFTGLPRVGVFSLMDSGDGQFGTIGDPYRDGQA
ncbi:MAG: hypothetical protein GF346_05475, partial [Candidatus Eisenbacteria bacterium]|nr:hypothetical protein [Candidatus Latescibacterota bacterium]MBD3301878.1 hypothetical protein [Candidatus Eisenbacteria bacterium]